MLVKNLLEKELNWIDCSAVKITGYSFRHPGVHSQHPCFTTVCNSDFIGVEEALFLASVGTVCM